MTEGNTENSPMTFDVQRDVNINFGGYDMDKPIYKSKKAMVAILGMIAVTAVAMTGYGDPAYYGAVAVIMGAAIGTQGAVDYKGESQ